MLHIITPSHFTTSTALFGVLRMTIRQLHQEKHQVIVIGDVDDTTHCRNQGVPVLGSCGGATNASKTLQKRLSNYIRDAYQRQPTKVMAWGWHAMVMTTGCSWEFDSYAIIDEVDKELLGSGGHTVISTSHYAISRVEQFGIPPLQMTEPLVGIEPTSVVLDKDMVRKQFKCGRNGLLVCVIGDLGSWREILAVANRLEALGQDATLVLPSSYRDRVHLMRAAISHGLDDRIQEIPGELRQVDVLLAADCAWCPPVAPFDVSFNVLDVLSAAAEMTPLAVHKTHPVATIPTIGSHIAWAENDTEVCGWMLNLQANNTLNTQVCAERVEMIRSIAAPTRFIEALQMRMHALA